MRSVLTRGVFVLALSVTFGLSGRQLLDHIRWEGYAGFVPLVQQGRRLTADLDLLAPALAEAGPQRCAVLHTTPLLALHLYATDLHILRAQQSPDATAEHDLEDHLRRNRNLVEQALACRPTDGDLWLNLALFARAMGDPAERIAGFLAQSRHHSPHEGWIARRRDRLF